MNLRKHEKMLTGKTLIKKILFLIFALNFICTNACAASGDGKSTETPAGGEKGRRSKQVTGYFDTVSSFIAYTDSENEFEALSITAENALRHYHELFNIYDDFKGVNNIKKINDCAGIKAVKVDPEIISLLDQCIYANKISGGRVNTALGPVLKLWHDAREKAVLDPEKAALPSIKLLRDKEKLTDISKILIDKKASSVFLPEKGMSLDVGSGAKGLACKLISEELIQKGYKNFLISLGGNVFAYGFRDGKSEKWNVAVQNPDTGSEGGMPAVLSVSGKAVVTSGTYQRYFMYEGKKYHHIIDPDSLFPENRFDSVTLVSSDSGLADSLATAVFNMDFDEGLKFINSIEDIEALWIKDEKLKMSDGMKRYLKH